MPAYLLPKPTKPYHHLNSIPNLNISKTMSDTDTNNLLIIIPSPWLGHLLPSLHFAHALLSRNHTFSVAVLLIESPFTTETSSFTTTLHTLNPSLKLIHIPKVDPSSLISTSNNNPMSIEAFASAYIELHKPYVKETVEKLVCSVSNMSLRFVLDMFCTSMIDVAEEFDSPCYTFVTTSAAFLGLIQFISTRPDFDEKSDQARINAYNNPVPNSVLPIFVFEQDGREAFSKHAKRIREETRGVIVNTFTELEEYALKSFDDYERFPPLYSVGPLLDLEGVNQVAELNEAERERIIRWLDDQEDESVVFLCFGSLGSFKTDQLNEIAAGLENSRVKFLWSVRKPPQQGNSGRPAEVDEPSETLPEGFLARTKGRGLVCGWAPQTNILAHKAVGGFVTHCGWNSILESIWFGVPTVAWPLYAEQQMNAFYMVKDLKLSIELKLDYKRHQEELVSAAEVESAVKCLMASDGRGREMRMRVKVMSERSRAAVEEGGSSFVSMGTLIEKMLDE